MIRRPLTGAALAWIAGTWFGLNYEIEADAISAAIVQLLILWAVAHLARRKGFITSVTPSIALLCAFAAIAALNATLRSQSGCGHENWLPENGLREDRCDLIGVIRNDPIPLPVGRARAAWCFLLNLEQTRANSNDTWRATGGIVEVQLYNMGRRLQPAYGERWQIAGARAVGETARNNVTTITRVIATTRPGAKSGAILLTRDLGNPFLAYCYRGRKAAGALLTDGIENRPGAVRIINAMLLGYRRQMEASIYHDFAATGTLHIFAISGSHVVVLAGIAIALLMALNIPRTRWFYALGPILILFTAATGMEPSAVRACIMALVYWGAVPLRRRPDIYNALGLAAILILAWDPYDLANVGFILSFATVLGLAILFTPLSRLVVRPVRDPLALPEPIPAWIKGRTAFLKLVASSIAAWLVSAPLTAYYFNTFSPIALVGNLIAIPLAFMIMLTGCLSLLTGVVWVWPGMVFNHANAVFADLLSWSMRRFAALPGGHWQVDPPLLWILAPYFILLAWIAQKYSSLDEHHGPAEQAEKAIENGAVGSGSNVAKTVF